MYVLQGARLSFEWLQFMILSRNLKVRGTLYDLKFACESGERSNCRTCSEEFCDSCHQKT